MRNLSPIQVTAVLFGMGILVGACGNSFSTSIVSPSLSDASPSSGLYLGGTELVLTGSGFVTAGSGPSVSLNVGGAATLSCQVSVASATSITCITPPYAPGGLAVISVTNPDGSTTQPFSGFTYLAPSVVLGQANTTLSVAALGASGMNSPGSLASDGVHLAVTDFGNNRVLLWNEIPTSTDQPADLVIGQTSMSGTSCLTPAAGTFCGPFGVVIFQGKLLVVDHTNNRVLVWNSWPTSNGQSADVVIGQTAMSASGTGTSAATLSAPGGVAVDPSGRLYISDYGNNRVLYFPSIPATNGASATYVVGQAGLSNSTGSTSQTGLHDPAGVSASASYLAVADSFSNRVMIFSAPPTGNGESAIAVLGQTGFTEDSSGCSPTAMGGPFGVTINSVGSLFVADSQNNRVLLWENVSSVTSGQAASAVFGQTDMNHCSANAGSIGQSTFNFPANVYLDPAGYLWVADAYNNRVSANLWQ